ncbi:MAG: PKD domain-containing protein [Bryobacteraceae bacterium]|jgi:hypothetical protein
MSKRCLLCAFLAWLFLPPQFGLERPDVTFKIFQFPPDKIPRIDGNTDDWAIVPDSYSIGMDQLMDTEQVAFKDESDGKITSWKWDFGDGSTSAEQNPVHQYKAGRDYTTILEVEGPAGKSRRANVWGVSVK